MALSVPVSSKNTYVYATPSERKELKIMQDLV